MVTVEEANMNFYFRDGDYEHSFENGQREHPGWRGRSEVDVLCERVAKGFKPVASIVMQPAWSKATCKQVIAKVEAHDLTFTEQRNEWGVSVLYTAAAPEKTLAELLVERGDDGVGLVLGAGVGERKVGWYVHRGFDMSSAINPVSALESALLLGYPLDLARSQQLADMCRRPVAVGTKRDR
jgi:hypothetical protein